MFIAEQSVATYRAWVRNKFGPLADELLALHPAATDAAATAAASAILGDAVFGESARLMARGLSLHKPKTFCYLFSRGVAGGPLAATHSEGLPLVSASLDKPRLIPHPPPDATNL